MIHCSSQTLTLLLLYNSFMIYPLEEFCKKKYKKVQSNGIIWVTNQLHISHVVNTH